MQYRFGTHKEVAYGSVTSIDFQEDSKYLVAGYEKGVVVIWDVVQKTQAKTISNLHDSAIIFLEITQLEPF